MGWKVCTVGMDLSQDVLQLGPGLDSGEGVALGK